MKKIWLIPLLILALVLAACADGGAAQTPGALGTEPVLGTDSGLGTDVATEVVEPTVAATEAATEVVEPTVAATEAATTAVEATTEVESGIVAIPYDMFTVASLTGQTGTGGETGAGTQAAGTQPASTQDAGTPQATTAAGTEPATTGTETANETAGDRMLVRASELLGSQVVDMNGDTVGSVDDVLVNETGLIQFVVVDAADYLQGTGGTGTGGDTGAGTPAAGTQDAATTPEAVGTLDDSTQVVGTVEPAGTTDASTPEGIATSAVGEGTAVGETGVMADEDTVLVFNGTADDLETQAVMLPENLLDDESAMLNISGGDMPANLAELNGLLRVSQLTNDNVLNAQEEQLGQVEDWIVDLEQGMVEYGVIDFGGFLGIAENTVAVPWAQFTVNAETDAAADANLMLDVTEDTLTNAPQLNMGEWPSWPSQLPTDWETETRTFWETAS